MEIIVVAIGMDSAKGMSKHQIQQNILKGKYDK